MVVRNVNGVSGGVCECGNWLTHWARYGGQTIPNWCPETNCVSKTEVGAHVQGPDPSDEGWYVVPLCRGHAVQVGQDLQISDAIHLVSANVKDTCGE